MIPAWPETLSVAFVLSGLFCAAVVTADLTRHRQTMWIMDIVWPLTALYSGPFGLWAYLLDRADARARFCRRHVGRGQGRYVVARRL